MTKGSFRSAFLYGVLALLAGCVATGGRGDVETLASIEAELRTHVEVLASDDFGGRRPGTEGETKTLQYLAGKWEAAGLVSATNDPGHPWFAPVELTVRRPGEGSANFTRNNRKLQFPADEVQIYTSGQRALLDNAPILFVGRQGQELDQSVLTGRVALMLWDHPAQEEQRAALFENGAAAVIALIPGTGEFAQRTRYRGGGSYRLANDDSAATIEGYMSLAAASDLFGQQRIASLRTAAANPAFKPRLLGVNADLSATNTDGSLRTHNLIAKLPGANPAEGAVLLMAHWDHFGICGDPANSDTICNGAVDNASGLAVLTGLANRLAKRGPFDRDIYFVATTAEEWGLLGATAFVNDPPLPLDSIVAAFNIDTIGVAGRGSKVAVVGAGLTALDSEVDAIIASRNRVRATGDFADRFVRRQDGWALLQRDVPTLMISSTFADPAVFEQYSRERYHRAGDNVDQVEYGAAAEDLLLHIDLAKHFATLASHPTGGQSQAGM